MGDIVARLRKDADAWGANKGTVTGPWVADIEREAAAEIERLRDTLEKITRLDSDDHSLTTAQFMARDALDIEQITDREGK